MTWNQVCADKNLASLPYHIETNRFGQIVMSPLRPRRSIYQSCIQELLRDLQPGGRAVPELALDTTDGTKSPDVAWVSDALLKKHIDASSFPVAPEICIEVMSPSNSRAEMTFKRQLYFERGALEFWVCDRKGRMTFFNRDGQIPKSTLCPAFPAIIGKDL